LAQVEIFVGFEILSHNGVQGYVCRGLV